MTVKATVCVGPTSDRAAVRLGAAGTGEKPGEQGEGPVRGKGVEGRRCIVETDPVAGRRPVEEDFSP